MLLPGYTVYLPAGKALFVAPSRDSAWQHYLRGVPRGKRWCYVPREDGRCVYRVAWQAHSLGFLLFVRGPFMAAVRAQATS